MPDIMLSINSTGSLSDVTVDRGDLQLDAGLQTAVVVSLFCDARADDTDVLPDGQTDKRGFWGDLPGARVGSKLWLLNREKMLPSVAERARKYAAEALQWMIDDGIALRVDVTAELSKPDRLFLGVSIYRGVNRDYDYLWEGVGRQHNISTVNLNSYDAKFALNFVTGEYELIT